MPCVPRGVVLACALLAASCSKDATKLADDRSTEMSPFVRAFAANLSQPTVSTACLLNGGSCATSAALRSHDLPKRSRVARREGSTASMLVPSTAWMSASSAYTIIADPEDFSLLSELVNALNGDGLRVLPVVGLSALTHLEDVAQHGVDLAVVPVNTLPFKIAVEERSGKRITYVDRLYDEALHVLASREITDVRQLDGRKVNIGPAGSGAEVAAQALFAALGIHPVVSTDNVEAARQRLQSGDIDAAVFLTPRPTHEVAAFTPSNFVHLLPVAHDLLQGELYEPAWLEAGDYPSMIESGARIPTVTVANVLAVLDAPAGSRLFRRVSRFMREYRARTSQLHEPGRAGPWRRENPVAEVPGWTRFRPAETRANHGRSRAGERAGE